MGFYTRDWETGEYIYNGPARDLCEFSEHLKHECDCGEDHGECPCDECERKRDRAEREAEGFTKTEAGSDPWSDARFFTDDEPPF